MDALVQHIINPEKGHTHLKSIIKFLSLFFVSAVFIFGIVFGLGWDGFQTLFQNEEGLAEGSEWIEKTFSLKGLTEYIAENPQHVSVVSFNVNDPDSGIFYNALTPRTMGALQNLLLLIEYERQAELGDIDPEKTVAPDALTPYLLPGIGESNHREAIKNIPADENGYLKTDDLVSAMVQYNDPAIADWLWFQLGEEHILNLPSLLQLTHTSAPLPFTGMYLAISPHFDSDSLNHHIMIEAARNYIADGAFHSRMKQLFKEKGLGLTFMKERDALSRFPQTQPKEFARLMARIQREEVISKTVSRRIKEKLGWVMQSQNIADSFENYGAMYDNRMGLLNGADFGTSAYDGHTSAQAVFFDRLPVGFWIHMSANHMQEDFQQRLIWDPALYETTLNQIRSVNE